MTNYLALMLAAAREFAGEDDRFVAKPSGLGDLAESLEAGGKPLYAAAPQNASVYGESHETYVPQSVEAQENLRYRANFLGEEVSAAPPKRAVDVESHETSELRRQAYLDARRAHAPLVSLRGKAKETLAA